MQYDDPDRRIDGIIDKQLQESASFKNLALRSIVECVIFCGKQGISFRGHRDDATTSDPTNRGNFISLLRFRAQSDDVLRRFIESAPKNSTYTSKTVQKDLIDLCGQYIWECTSAPVMKNKFFSVIADEVTDSSNNHSILGVSHRLLDVSDPVHPRINEVFFDFVQLDRTNSETVCRKLVECYTSRGIDLKKVRGQTYDTTSSMSSAVNGVHGRFKSIYSKAIYLPNCHAHILNLCISSSCKLPPIRNVIDMINEWFLFFHNSPKRQAFFETVLEKCFPDATQVKLKGLCRTRWVERHEAYENFMALIPAAVMTADVIVHPHLYETLSFENWSWDKDTKEKANGLASSARRFENIVSFVVQKNSLHPLKGIAAKLQKRDLDIYEAYQRVDETISCLQSYRTNVDEFHSRCYAEVKQVAEEISSVEERPRTVRSQQHRANVPAESTEEYFKRSITIPFLDFLVSEMATRFSEQNRGPVIGIFFPYPQDSCSKAAKH